MVFTFKVQGQMCESRYDCEKLLNRGVIPLRTALGVKAISGEMQRFGTQFLERSKKEESLEKIYELFTRRFKYNENILHLAVGVRDYSTQVLQEIFILQDFYNLNRTVVMKKLVFDFEQNSKLDGNVLEKLMNHFRWGSKRKQVSLTNTFRHLIVEIGLSARSHEHYRELLNRLVHNSESRHDLIQLLNECKAYNSLKSHQEHKYHQKLIEDFLTEATSILRGEKWPAQVRFELEEKRLRSIEAYYKKVAEREAYKKTWGYFFERVRRRSQIMFENFGSGYEINLDLSKMRY